MDYSKIPSISLEGLTKKDRQLISENPNASMDSLIEKGLSKKAEDKLNDLSSNIKKVEAKPQSLIPKVMKVAPQTGRNPQHQVLNDSVKYRNNQTGVVVKMSRKAATILQRNKPSKGSIVN